MFTVLQSRSYLSLRDMAEVTIFGCVANETHLTIITSRLVHASISILDDLHSSNAQACSCSCCWSAPLDWLAFLDF